MRNSTMAYFRFEAIVVVLVSQSVSPSVCGEGKSYRLLLPNTIYIVVVTYTYIYIYIYVEDKLTVHI